MWNRLEHKISIFQQPLKVLRYCIRQQNHQERVKMAVTAKKEIWPIWFRIISMKKLPPKKVNCKIISLIWKAPLIFHILPPINQGPGLGLKGSEREGGLWVRHVWEAMVQLCDTGSAQAARLPQVACREQRLHGCLFSCLPYGWGLHAGLPGVYNRKMVAGECWQFNMQPQ